MKKVCTLLLAGMLTTSFVAATGTKDSFVPQAKGFFPTKHRELRRRHKKGFFPGSLGELKKKHKKGFFPRKQRELRGKRKKGFFPGNLGELKKKHKKGFFPRRKELKKCRKKGFDTVGRDVIRATIPLPAKTRITAGSSDDFGYKAQWIDNETIEISLTFPLKEKVAALTVDPKAESACQKAFIRRLEGASQNEVTIVAQPKANEISFAFVAVAR